MQVCLLLTLTEKQIKESDRELKIVNNECSEIKKNQFFFFFWGGGATKLCG